jgi:hypothetical protein
MAGDIRIDEEAIVYDAGAPDAGDLAAAIFEDSRVTHKYGERVLIAAVPPDGARALERQVPSATVTAEAGAIPEAAKSELDEVGALGLEAFALRRSDEYVSAKARRPLDGEPWDSENATAPDHPLPDVPEGAVMVVPAGRRLTGRLAVGLVIVEGPEANGLAFTDEERAEVTAEVQNGLTWLGSQGVRAVTWVYDIQTVTLDVEPDYSTDTYEAGEAPWRDPALAELGFEAGHAGVRAYAEDLQDNHNTAGVYCAFFTKYPLHHFAYAYRGAAHLVMHYDNDGWGPNNIDRVFAHETGHIFGAPDEYEGHKPPCNCGGKFGYAQWPNKNCEECLFGGKVACIMKGNDWEMCSHTPCHLGYDVIVPRVREWTEADAAEEIRKAGLTVRIIGPSGHPDAWVENQSPAAGTITGACDTVTVQLSTDPMP